MTWLVDRNLTTLINLFLQILLPGERGALLLLLSNTLRNKRLVSILIRVFFLGPQRTQNQEGAPPLGRPEARRQVKSRTSLARFPFKVPRSLGASGGPSGNLNHDHGSQTGIFNSFSFVFSSSSERCFQQKQSGSNKTFFARLDQEKSI